MKTENFKNFDYEKAGQDLNDVLSGKVKVKPILIEDKMYCCPICYNNLLPKWKKYPTELTPLSAGLPKCLSCGAKIDWDKGDE